MKKKISKSKNLQTMKPVINSVSPVDGGTVQKAGYTTFNVDANVEGAFEVAFYVNPTGETVLPPSPKNKALISAMGNTQASAPNDYSVTMSNAKLEVGKTYLFRVDAWSPGPKHELTRQEGHFTVPN